MTPEIVAFLCVMSFGAGMFALYLLMTKPFDPSNDNEDHPRR